MKKSFKANTLQTTKIVDYENVEYEAAVWSIDDFVINNEDYPLISSLAYKINGDLREGTYVEIGAGHYRHGNNTFVLEKEYGWKGVSIDKSKFIVDDFNKNRKNLCIEADATKFNWDTYLEENNFPKQIDFLSIDIDFETHEYANFLALISLPLTKYIFNVIIIEHGSVLDYKNDRVRDLQREVLSLLGYHLIIRGSNEDFWTIFKPDSINGLSQIGRLFKDL